MRNFVPVCARLFEAYKKGEARLHVFTAAELAAVTLQAGALPAPVGPVLHMAPQGPPQATPAAVKAVKALERQGFIRPWPPAAPKHPPGPGRARRLGRLGLDGPPAGLPRRRPGHHRQHPRPAPVDR